MTIISHKKALVIGGSSGVGKETVKALISEGAYVTAVARGRDGLHALSTDSESLRDIGTSQAVIPSDAPPLTTRQGDATDPAFANDILRELQPDILVLAAGITPPMGPLDELEWDTFSETWNTDLKSTFHFLKLALTLPLPPGSTIVIVSSGAAINGSPLAGGYAGAKRMQWLLAGYAQKLSDAKQLGIRMVTVLPSQLIEGTAIGARASAAYGAVNGITGEAFMKRFAVPLDAATVASAIMQVLRGDIPAGVQSIAVSGKGIETLQ